MGIQINQVLILIPCCKTKGRGPGIVKCEKRVEDYLPSEAREKLSDARQRVRRLPDCKIESEEMVAALDRYNGFLYTVPDFKTAVMNFVEKGGHLLIVSALYGLLRPEEKICDYELKMDKSYKLWKTCFEEILKGYISHNQIRSVVGVFSKSSKYWKLLESVDWKRDPRGELEEVFLCYPVCSKRGCQWRVPRAQGVVVRETMNRMVEEGSVSSIREVIPKKINEVEGVEEIKVEQFFPDEGKLTD